MIVVRYGTDCMVNFDCVPCQLQEHPGFCFVGFTAISNLLHTNTHTYIVISMFKSEKLPQNQNMMNEVTIVFKQINYNLYKSTDNAYKFNVNNITIP